jgi:1,4-dihydroxy-2-naphthoyl-CoA hydrolase
MDTIFKTAVSLEQLNANSHRNMLGHLGIEFTEIGADYLVARMPVDARTHQPFGLLHGGASVVLAESLGSSASWLCLEKPTEEMAVGLEINANHLKSARSGWVYGRCSPIRVGRRVHVWDIRISDEQGETVCVSRLTVAVVPLKNG